MRKSYGWILLLWAALTLASGCAKEEIGNDFSPSEMEAEWAAAFYTGTDEDGQRACYELDLTRGRIGEDLELLSPGFVVHLIIGTDLPEELALPEGSYESQVCGDVIPYISLLQHSAGRELRYPVEEGRLDVKRLEDGSYRLHAELQSTGRSFSLSYEGKLPTYDYTEPQ